MNSNYITTEAERGTRSLFQPRIWVACSIISLIFIIINLVKSSQLDIEDALFLTRNSIKEFKEMYLPNGLHLGGDEGVFTDAETYTRRMIHNDFDLDFPLNGVMNSVFPIDSFIEFNTSVEFPDNLSLYGDDTKVTPNQLIGRYASFSSIITNEMNEQYKIFPGLACEAINGTEYPEYYGKIFVVLRGECTFVDKVSSIVESDLNPRAIIIANNEPYRSLITMYSATFNSDGSLKTPIMFITNEDYKILKYLEEEEPNTFLRLSTASLGNWWNVLISMTLSPPILILLFYTVVKGLQFFRKRRLNKLNEKIVKQLPVYIFNQNHIIPSKSFYDYITITRQSDRLSSIPSSDSGSGIAEANPQSIGPTPKSSTSSMQNLVINGVDLEGSTGKKLNILTAPKDYYHTFKCSICLDSFKPLKSRVLVLDCKHIFHEKCLSNWLINFKRSCPLCNNTLKNNELPYLLAGQESQNNYGSISNTDLEAQREDILIHDESSNDFADSPSSSPSSVHSNDVIEQSLMIEFLEPNETEIPQTPPTNHQLTVPNSANSNASSASNTSFYTTHTTLNPSSIYTSSQNPVRHYRELIGSHTQLQSLSESLSESLSGSLSGSLDESHLSIDTDSQQYATPTGSFKSDSPNTISEFVSPNVDTETIEEDASLSTIEAVNV